MSQINARGFEEPATAERLWERPAAADDIVDPIDIGSGPFPEAAFDAEQSDEEAEDVPLDVKLTDALSMLADGGHDYGSRPVIEEDLERDSSLDAFEIDESSKDA